MIRSAAGAQYYAYWSLASGEAPRGRRRAPARRGLAGSGPRPGRGIAALLPEPALPGGPGRSAAASPTCGRRSDGGRLDTAIDVLALMPPSADLLPVLIDLVTRTLSPRSIRVLHGWRDALGEPPIEEVLAARPADGQRGITIASESLPDALPGRLRRDAARTERARPSRTCGLRRCPG